MIETIKVSMVANAHATETTPVKLLALLRGIQDGRWLASQEAIRAKRKKKLLETGGDRKAAKLAIKKDKEALPGVTFAGLCSHRANDGWIVPSDILAVDLDNLDSDLPIVREKLRQSPHLLFDCESVTGSGLHALFLISIGEKPDEEKYRAYFEAVRQHVLELCGVDIDPQCKDPARLSFVSADRGARLNLEATRIVLPPPAPKAPKEPETGKASVNSRAEHNSKPGKAQIREMLAVIPKRPHYHDWITLCAAVGDALSLSDAVEVLEEWSPEEEAGEYAQKLQSGFEKIHVGTLFHIAKQHGWKPGDSKEKSVPRKSAATELVELAEKFTFFHDGQDRPFVRLEKDGHLEIWPVESTKFRKLLARAYYKKMKKAINRNALADAITTLAGKACHDGGEEPVFLRVAPHDGNILIDLCDEQWRVVEVTPEGWRILERSPVAFIRTGSMQALPLPVQGGGSIAPLVEAAQRERGAASACDREFAQCF